MNDVNKIFITKEVADEISLNPSYLIKLAKKIGLNENEMRQAGTRNYLFSEEGVKKLKKHINETKNN